MVAPRMTRKDIEDIMGDLIFDWQWDRLNDFLNKQRAWIEDKPEKVEWDIDSNLPLYTRDYLKQSGYLRGITVGYKIGDAVYNPDDVTIIREERCPTCQGRVWSVKLGKWINTRETVDMICQTCGHNYLEEL